MLYFRLLLNGRHIARPVIEAIPSETERSDRTHQAAQLTGSNKGTNVVPGRRHDLRRGQLVVTQNILNYWVERKPKAVIESRMVDCNVVSGRLVNSPISLENYERSERVGVPGNSSPSATISGIDPTGVWPLSLSTNLPGVEGSSRDEELVDAPSEDECLDDLSEEQEDVPLKEELVLRPFLPPALKNLGRNKDYLEHPRPATHRGISYRIPRGSAGLKNRHRIGNLFGFPKLIFFGEHPRYPAINKGREVRELGMTTLHMGTDPFLKDIPLDKQDEDMGA
ncbi:LOW QUALITY PROTEIN: hypothetical protein Cgig2_023814 [Carnegiea gigantea]|uniref:Uncharacterized protein n=1 Tax=Carnegiea gigantea TaxID=171969 RepID=A0A9Q1Q9U0_9CARY|nr:LOW QUALITY PROTEIN: hypothetical protein Cgig2_023814 [Carnegiea gigantea]